MFAYFWKAFGMVRRFHSAGPTVKTVIGFLRSGEEVALEMIGHELFVTLEGERIAQRQRQQRAKTKTWLQMKRGWRVTDTRQPLELEIERNGVRLEWAGRAEQP